MPCITGYLVGTLDRFNDAKRAEEHDRVKHGMQPVSYTHLDVYKRQECIYRHKPASFCEATEMLDRYINFYHYERIQLKTGVAPLTLRHSA